MPPNSSGIGNPSCAYPKAGATTSANDFVPYFSSAVTTLPYAMGLAPRCSSGEFRSVLVEPSGCQMVVLGPERGEEVDSSLHTSLLFFAVRSISPDSIPCASGSELTASSFRYRSPPGLHGGCAAG